jgi:hypothetical protein
VVKQHLNTALHEREVHAYGYWTTVLGPSAPVLAAVDEAAMIIAVSARTRHLKLLTERVLLEYSLSYECSTDTARPA